MPRFDKLLVLDLDETLIYAKKGITNRNPDFTTRHGYPVYKRPHLDEFLEYCKNSFEIGLWTQGKGWYLTSIADVLFRDYDLKFKWSREQCSEDDDGDLFIKNLNKIEREVGVDLSKIIVIDDDEEHYTKEDKKNMLRFVRPWYGELNDNYLQQLPELLDDLGPVHDVRLVLGS